MSKGLKGFLIGLFVIVVGFVLGVLISSSVHNTTFVDEIGSWFKGEETATLPDEENTGNDDVHTEVEDDIQDVTTTSIITITNDNISLKVA